MENHSLYENKKVNNVNIVKVPYSRATHENAKQFLDYINDLIKAEEKFLVVNLPYCDFIDSSFLGALVKVFKRLKLEKGDLKIVIPEKMPEGILELTVMNQILDFHNQVNTAMSSFN